VRVRVHVRVRVRVRVCVRVRVFCGAGAHMPVSFQRYLEMSKSIKVRIKRSKGWRSRVAGLISSPSLYFLFGASNVLKSSPLLSVVSVN